MADFGISKACSALRDSDTPESVLSDAHGGAEQHTVGVGTPRYAAPETWLATSQDLSASTYDQRIDVYSFALLLWEMTHNEIAFDGVTGVQAALIAARGSRPPISPTQSQSDLSGFGALIEACWRQDPSERISMAACAEQLVSMLRHVEGPPAPRPLTPVLDDSEVGLLPAAVVPDVSSVDSEGAGASNSAGSWSWSAKVGNNLFPSYVDSHSELPS